MSRGTPVHDEIRSVLQGADDRRAKSIRVAEAIRRGGDYRWVGLYEVEGTEIVALGWSGPGAPTHPRFPVSEGLCGAAVAARGPIIVGDVRRDPRYLTTFGSTRAEIVVPIVRADREPVLGVIDVESDRPNVFGEADRLFLEGCASVIAQLWVI